MVVHTGQDGRRSFSLTLSIPSEIIPVRDQRIEMESEYFLGYFSISLLQVSSNSSRVSPLENDNSNRQSLSSYEGWSEEE